MLGKPKLQTGYVQTWYMFVVPDQQLYFISDDITGLLRSACFRCAAGLSQAVKQVAASRQKHTLPDLTYDYGALEPHINAEIMQLHHSKHHATYVNNLNVTEEKYQEALAKGKNNTFNKLNG